jgi:hypothetical protein
LGWFPNLFNFFFKRSLLLLCERKIINQLIFHVFNLTNFVIIIKNWFF